MLQTGSFVYAFFVHGSHRFASSTAIYEKMECRGRHVANRFVCVRLSIRGSHRFIPDTAVYEKRNTGFTL